MGGFSLSYQLEVSEKSIQFYENNHRDMGAAKRDFMEQQERGYKAVAGSVCEDCIDDKELRSLLLSDSQLGDCDFCGNVDVQVTKASRIQERVMESFALDYEDTQQSDGPYESKEGGLMIPYEPASEVIADNLSSSVSEAFLESLTSAVEWVDWSNPNWAVLSQPDWYRNGWKQFCHVVRHKLRFSFAWEQGFEDPDHPDYMDPTTMLERLGALVDDLDLIKIVPEGTEIFRTRINTSEFFGDLEAIGTPPHRFVGANRMSPAGIPMFYGADDIETTIAETWDGEGEVKASIGTFRLKRDIRIIDFARLPEPPSYWDPERRRLREDLGFLHQFARELSAPVDRGEMVDIPYTPTQVVCEFLTKGRYPRPGYGDKDGFDFPVHGLAFNSSRASGKNFALNLLNISDRRIGFRQNRYFDLIEVEKRVLSQAESGNDD